MKLTLSCGIFAMAVLCVSSVGAQNPQEIDNNTAWLMVNTAIIDHLKGLDKTLLDRYSIQLPAADVDAAWDDPDEGPWSLLEMADSLADWSPVWTANTGTRFSDAYGDFVGWIAVPTRADVSEATRAKAEKAWTAAADKARAERTRWLAEWKKEGHKGAPTQDWWRDNAAPHVNPLEDARDKKFTDYFNLLDPEAITTGKQIAKWKNYAPVPYKTPCPTAPDCPTENHYAYYASNQALTRIKTDGEAQYKAQKGTSWEFKSGTSYRHDERESWGANASYGGFVNLGGGGSRHTLDTNNTSVRISFMFYKLGIVPITPADWYTGVLVKKYKNGPFKPNSPISASTLWGPNGSLRLRAAAVVVAYKPQITAYLSKADYSLLEEKYHAGGSVSIGPFSVGGSHDRQFETEKSNGQEGKFSVESVSPNPQVIAILFEKLNP